MKGQIFDEYEGCDEYDGFVGWGEGISSEEDWGGLL